MHTILVALWLILVPALAQEVPVLPPLHSDAVAQAGDDEAAQEAVALYRLGLDLVGQGKYAEGCAVFQKVTDRYPGTDYAVKAEEQMAMAALVEGGDVCGGAPPEDVGRADTAPRGRKDDGRLELTISQALVGPALIGAFLPASMGITEPAVYLSMGLVGLGAGIGLPLAITHRHPVSVGQAMLIYSGESIGGWNGVFLAAAIDGVDDVQTAFALVTGGIVLGGLAGVGSAIALHPSAGQVAMFRSGFTWGMYFGGISFLAAGAGDATSIFLRLGSFSDLGAVVGAVAAVMVPIGRSHMNVINLSGYAGALAFSMVYGIIALAAESTSEGAWFTVLSTGAVAGLATGIAVSRKMDGDGAAWLGRGAALGVEDGRVVFGAPMPSPRITPGGGLGINVHLAHGRF
ncbi:MAG: hypothetical protein JRI25_05360 [Deltaproteobacteria bacterium]|nr:hypothetical protein [Deltaproteobacteria bacterium]